jgi:hypothetical protein
MDESKRVGPAARLARGAGRHWRHSSGRHRAGDTAEAPDYDRRLEYCERKLAEVYCLMQLVCNELRVDTSPADETVPMLRVIDGGRAG